MKNKDVNNLTFTVSKKGFAAKLVTFLMKKIVIGKTKFVFHDEHPVEPSVFVANHTRAKGPLTIQYLYPGDVRTWSNAKLIEKKSCYEHFKTNIIKNIRGEWFFKLLLPIGIPIVNWYYKKQLNCIPVYHDMNISKTFTLSTQTLVNGVNIAVYPEIKETVQNEILSHFAVGFTYMGFYYYRETGKRLNFYPVYIAQSLRQIHFGKPIAYDPDIPMKEQTAIICNYLEDNITSIARSLPKHRIVTVYGDYKEHTELK